MAPEEIQLEVSEEVKNLCRERGIRIEQIEQVIQHAEAAGDKLHQSGTDRYLAKLKISEPTFYTEYSTKEGGYIVHTAYWHYSELSAESKAEESDTEVQPMVEQDKIMADKWYCFKCKERMGEEAVGLSYAGVGGGQVGIKCPKCEAAYILEQTVLEVVRKNEDEVDEK